MRKFIVVLLIINFFVIPCTSSKKLNSKKDKNLTKNISFKDLTGYWISKRFIDVLLKTKSPIRASEETARLSSFEGLNIYKDNKSYKMTQYINFHEFPSFELLKIEKSSNKYVNYFVKYRYYFEFNDKIEYGEDIKTTGIILVVNKNGQRQLHCPDPFEPHGKKYIFQKLNEELSEFINKNTIAGKYINQEGEEYIFNIDGKFKMGNMNGKYRVRNCYEIT